jgi:hypothetical protein
MRLARNTECGGSPEGFGASPEKGLWYSQTVSPPGVTSKKRPEGPEQMKVFPVRRRWAPDRKSAKNERRSAAVYVQVGRAGPNAASGAIQ